MSQPPDPRNPFNAAWPAPEQPPAQPNSAPRPFGMPSYESTPGQVPFGVPTQGWVPPPPGTGTGTPYVAPKSSDGNPRVIGLVLLVLSLGLVALNYWSITTDGKFFIQPLAITPMMFLAGIWILVAGAPEDPRTGDMVTWARVGLGSVSVVGLVLGIGACFYVGC